MSDPIAEYGAKVMPKGFKISADVRSGLSATVPYLVPWANAFLFSSAIINPIYTTRVGSITFTLPYRFPTTATPIYAQSFDILPCGIDPDLNVATVLPNRGLAPGEYFEWAIVTVGFQQLQWTFGPNDDPSGLAQLDPGNPIYFCEQSVKMGGKMVTRKGINYVYSATGNPVVGDVGVFVPETKLIVRFPRIPYLPWQFLQPYTGTVNSNTIFFCPSGTLLLEEPDTTAKAALNSPASTEQSLSLQFAYDRNGWNSLPQPNGVYSAVTVAGDSSKSIYPKADHRDILNYIQLNSS